MVTGVSTDEHDLKVFQSIVVPDLVSVMHVLVSVQLALKVRLHDMTVLKHKLTVDLDSDVSIRADKASCVLDLSPALHFSFGKIFIGLCSIVHFFSCFVIKWGTQRGTMDLT